MSRYYGLRNAGCRTFSAVFLSLGHGFVIGWRPRAARARARFAVAFS